MQFPSAGIVYDYRLEDGGISRSRKNKDDDEDDQSKAVVSSNPRVVCLQGFIVRTNSGTISCQGQKKVMESSVVARI